MQLVLSGNVAMRYSGRQGISFPWQTHAPGVAPGPRKRGQPEAVGASPL